MNTLHADTLVTELRDAWQQPGAGHRTYSGQPYQPIASTDQDQPTPAGIHNPLWDIVRWMPASPPWYEGNHAAHALSVYQGDLLLYAGEGWGGCTADDSFYELLDAEWIEVSESPRHVTWSGIHCTLKAYRRRINMEA